MPSRPQKPHGMRIEPPPSVPSASGTMPAASAAALPPLEPPARALEVPRVARDAGQRAVGDALPAELGRRRLAEQHGAVRAQRGDGGRVVVPRAGGIDRARAAQRRPAAGEEDVLDRRRARRRARRPARRGASAPPRRAASASARSASTRQKALSAGSSRSMRVERGPGRPRPATARRRGSRRAARWRCAAAGSSRAASAGSGARSRRAGSRRGSAAGARVKASPSPATTSSSSSRLRPSHGPADVAAERREDQPHLGQQLVEEVVEPRVAQQAHELAVELQVAGQHALDVAGRGRALRVASSAAGAAPPRPRRASGAPRPPPTR